MTSVAPLWAHQQPNLSSTSYEQRKPEETLLYQLIEQYYPELKTTMEDQGRPLPLYVQEEFDAYLRCGRLEHGFFRLRCESCHHERFLPFSCKLRGFCPSCCGMRMVESAAHLVDKVLPHQPMRQWVLSFPYPLRLLFARELHYHMLFLDGVYQKPSERSDLVFKKQSKLLPQEIQVLTEKVCKRVLGYLERHGLIEGDIESRYLSGDLLSEDDCILDFQGSSITYRIAVGPQKGQKVLTLKLLPETESQGSSSTELLGKIEGFSLHAGVAVSAKNRKQLEKICRYITRPSLSTQRLSMTSNGKVRYELKTAYRDGTSHVIFTPLDFIARLAALVPTPRVNLTRIHGVFAPNSSYRRLIIPQQVEKVRDIGADKGHTQNEGERQTKMTWAQRLKRVFDIEITVCEHCVGKVKIIACIEDQATIDKILAHVRKKNGTEEAGNQWKARAPPKLDLLGNLHVFLPICFKREIF